MVEYLKKSFKISSTKYLQDNRLTIAKLVDMDGSKEEIHKVYQNEIISRGNEGEAMNHLLVKAHDFFYTQIDLCISFFLQDWIQKI